MKHTFLKYDKPLLTVMTLANNPDRIKELVDRSIAEGAEAFGMQLEKLEEKYKNSDVYRDIFRYAEKYPIYATSYRKDSNAQKTDEEIAEDIIRIAECGATLCDVMGDYFDRQPNELAVDKNAIEKQKELINTLHKKGAEVLMSSHVHKFTPADRVLEIALEHQSRGADISKIVTGADTMEQQIENLRITHLLKQNLKIPFLFLCGGECDILRKISGKFGSCMYLCVYEHDDYSICAQPLLKNVKQIRDNL